MQLTIQEISLVFFASFGLSAVLTLLFREIAIALGVVDHPNQQHKTHVEPIPYLGGLSIVATVIIGLSLSFVLKLDYQPRSAEMLVLIVAPLLLATVGLLDDLKNLGALSRLIAQTISGLFVSLIFVEFEWYGEPTDSQLFNSLATIFWIVGITNALNFIDNLDGGAGGIAIICAFTLAFAAMIGNQFALAALAVLLAGATLGFLIWNLYPARIYLGDAGALFLGSILAVLTIRLDPATPNPFSGWFFAFLLFAVPILDTSVAVISRLLRGVSIFQGGRDHLSHRLLKLGLSKKLTAALIWSLQTYFSALATLLLFANSQEALVVELIAALSWLILLTSFLRLNLVTS